MTPKEYFFHESLCSLPWIGVYINPDGTVKNCAISNEKLGNLHSTPLEKILLGPTNVLIKKDMLANIKHDRCGVCYRNEHNSKSGSKKSSNRSWYKKYGIKNVSSTMYRDPANFDLKTLDLRWRNTCNLACVYCGPDLSSKWASELNIQSYRIDEAVLTQNKQYILDNLDNINHVYLAGGEPLLIKENLELLNLLHEQNPDVEIRINTNLFQIDNEIFKKLILFKNVKWTVSVDAIKDEFEYIRYPGHWNKFYDNLMYLKDQEFDINFNMVWFVLNSTSIFDCIDLLQQSGFHENTFMIQCLEDPLPLSIRCMPDVYLEELKLILKQKLAQTNSKYWLHKSIDSMYNFIDGSFLDLSITSTFDFLNVLDQRRGLDSRSIFPMLYNINI
jgi:MoaA/NifB/PqqE/SkfB family radical SAM enzyme